MKKIPESSPNCWAVIPSSLFIVNDAKLMFVRSRNATTYSRKRNGISLIRNLVIVLPSNDVGVITDISLMSEVQIFSVIRKLLQQCLPCEQRVPLARCGARARRQCCPEHTVT